MKKLLGLIAISLLGGSAAGVFAAYQQYGSWRHRYEFDKPLALVSNGSGGVSVPKAEQTLRARAFIQGDAVHDFGVMSRNEKRSHVFIVENRGNAPLSLRFVDKSCQCTDVSISKTEIEPNGTSEVTLTWQPVTFRPDFQQTARFQTNDPARVELDMTVKGRVQQIVELVPPAVSLEGIAAGQTHQTSVDLIGYRERPINATRVEFLDSSSAHLFSAKIEPLSADALAQMPNAVSGSRITVEVQPGLPIGRFAQRMRVTMDQDDLEPLEVPMQGTVSGNITLVGPGYDAQSRIWDLGKIAGASPPPKTIWLIIKGADTRNVQIRVVSVDPADVLEATLAEPNRADKLIRQGLTLRIRPVGRVVNRLGSADAPAAKIVLETNIPESPRLEIPVTFALEESVN